MEYAALASSHGLHGADLVTNQNLIWTWHSDYKIQSLTIIALNFGMRVKDLILLESNMGPAEHTLPQGRVILWNRKPSFNDQNPEVNIACSFRSWGE